MPKKAAAYYIVEHTIINRGGADPVFKGNVVTAADFPALPDDTIERHVANGALRPATAEEQDQAEQGLLPGPGTQPPNVAPAEVAASQPPELQALRQEVADLRNQVDALSARSEPAAPAHSEK